MKIFLLIFLLLSFDSEARSARAVYQFKKTHICPSTGRYSQKCPGYIVDHIKALACNGPDTPANMQYQTKAAAKAKDKWERKGCR